MARSTRLANFRLTDPNYLASQRIMGLQDDPRAGGLGVVSKIARALMARDSERESKAAFDTQETARTDLLKQIPAMLAQNPSKAAEMLIANPELSQTGLAVALGNLDYTRKQQLEKAKNVTDLSQLVFQEGLKGAISAEVAKAGREGRPPDIQGVTTRFMANNRPSSLGGGSQGTLSPIAQIRSQPSAGQTIPTTGQAIPTIRQETVAPSATPIMKKPVTVPEYRKSLEEEFKLPPLPANIRPGSQAAQAFYANNPQAKAAISFAQKRAETQEKRLKELPAFRTRLETTREKEAVVTRAVNNIFELYDKGLPIGEEADGTIIRDPDKKPGGRGVLDRVGDYAATIMESPITSEAQYELDSIIENIKSAIGIEQLIKAKEQGATFGALQKSEMDLLIASFGAIKSLRTPEAVKRSLTKIKNVYSRAARRQEDQFSEQYGADIDQPWKRTHITKQGDLYTSVSNQAEYDKIKSGTVYYNTNDKKLFTKQ